MDFLHTAKVFPTNLLSAILSVNIIYAKCCFHSCQKKTMKIFPTFSDKLLNFYYTVLSISFKFTPTIISLLPIIMYYQHTSVMVL